MPVSMAATPPARLDVRVTNDASPRASMVMVTPSASIVGSGDPGRSPVSFSCPVAIPAVSSLAVPAPVLSPHPMRRIAASDGIGIFPAHAQPSHPRKRAAHDTLFASHSAGTHQEAWTAGEVLVGLGFRSAKPLDSRSRELVRVQYLTHYPLLRSIYCHPLNAAL